MAPTAAEATRPEAIQHQRETSTESHQEGPSNPKEKGRDPREWRNIHLNENEMDAALQQAALESYKERNQFNKDLKKCTCRRKASRGREPSQRCARPPESRPVAQMTPDSFLGIALRNLEKRRGEPSDEPTSSSLSLSGSNSDESQSYNSSYSSVPRRR